MPEFSGVRFIHSVNFVLSSVIIVVTLSVMGGFLSFHYINAKRVTLKNIEKSSENTALRMSQYLALPMWAVEKEVIESFIEAEMRNSDIKKILIMDQTGSGLISGMMRYNGIIHSVSDINPGSDANENLVASEKDIYLHDISDKKLGSVKVFYSCEPSLKAISRFFISLGLTIAVLVVILVSIVWFFTTKFILKPVENLSFQTRRMVLGNLKTPVKTNINNEVKVLERNIENLRKTMAAAFRKLMNSH